MMSTFVTADHHFGHANIIQYVNRPFQSVDQMNQAMIDAWNATVGPDDNVYHLGDFTLTESLSPWIHALQFKTLHIVPGGHDHRWLKEFCSYGFQYRIEILPSLFTLEIPSGNKYPHVVVLCHYPMMSWDRSHYGSVHLHGHTHGTIPNGRSDDMQLPPGQSRGQRIDIGIDSWNFAPVALERFLPTQSKEGI